MIPGSGHHSVFQIRAGGEHGSIVQQGLVALGLLGGALVVLALQAVGIVNRAQRGQHQWSVAVHRGGVKDGRLSLVAVRVGIGGVAQG